MGRKSLDGTMGKSPPITLRLKPQQFDHLDVIVDTIDHIKTRSAAMRWLIDEHFDRVANWDAQNKNIISM